MIYADFESILALEDNVSIIQKQDPQKSYTKKYQKNIAFSYDYKLAYVLMTSLVSLLRHTSAEMQFTVSLII